MEYLQIKNWKRFQHYTDRNPPWIKLHFEILSSQDWVTLDDASRVLAIASMLIASKDDGKVPNDPIYMQRVAYLNQLANFKPLIKCGFFEKVLADASVLQADARPETEKETEKDIDKKMSQDDVTVAMIYEWANKNIPKHINLENELSKFKNYNYKRKPKNWIRAFENWLRKSVDYNPSKEKKAYNVWKN